MNQSNIFLQFALYQLEEELQEVLQVEVMLAALENFQSLGQTLKQFHQMTFVVVLLLA